MSTWQLLLLATYRKFLLLTYYLLLTCVPLTARAGAMVQRVLLLDDASMGALRPGYPDPGPNTSLTFALTPT